MFLTRTFKAVSIQTSLCFPNGSDAIVKWRETPAMALCNYSDCQVKRNMFEPFSGYCPVADKIALSRKLLVYAETFNNTTLFFFSAFDPFSSEEQWADLHQCTGRGY